MRNNFLRAFQVGIGAAGICICVGQAAAYRPGDSVTSGVQRGQWSRPINSYAPPNIQLLPPTPMRVSSLARPYSANFGPYRNGSRSTIKIVLSSLEQEGVVRMRGLVNGIEEARGEAAISFLVHPSDEYLISVDGYTQIHVFANIAGQLPSDVGLPTSNDFSRPRGTFIQCVSQGDLLKHYLYEAGSMTDHSHIGWGYLGATLGPEVEGVSCQN